MKTKIMLFAMASICCGLAAIPARGGEPPVGTGFTYQGQLKESGVPVNSLVDLEFRLFNGAVSGVQIGDTQTHADVSVVNGLFTAEPDFGAGAFNGLSRWLEVSVANPAGSGNFSTLSPRQAISATPYAQRASHANSAFAMDASDGFPTNAVFVNNAGNVGIGTTAPGTKLHIDGADEGIRIEGPASGAANAAFMTFYDASGTRIGFVGDGSASDTNTFLASDSGDVILYTSAGPVVTAKSNGNVGIGTTTPNKKLTVDGNMEIGTGSGDYHHLRIGGGNSDGFLYGSFPRFGDGIHMGYNYYADAAGNNQVIHSDGQTSRISMGYGYIGLAVGGVGAAPGFDRLWIDSVGNVHISAIPFGDFQNVQWNVGDKLLYQDNSTRRHKENIKPLKVDFERLLDSEPVTYTRPGRPDRWEIGFIAEDMHDLGLTELVSYDAEGKPDGYNYEKSTLYLVAIAKAQRDQIAEQRARLAALEQTLGVLADQMAEMARSSARP